MQEIGHFKDIIAAVSDDMCGGRAKKAPKPTPKKRRSQPQKAPPLKKAAGSALVPLFPPPLMLTAGYCRYISIPP